MAEMAVRGVKLAYERFGGWIASSTQCWRRLVSVGWKPRRLIHGSSTRQCYPGPTLLPLSPRIVRCSGREDSVALLPAAWFDGFVELCMAFLTIDITPRLSKIHCPTTVIVGKEDILKPVKFSEIIARGIPGAMMKIIPGAGHAVVIEQPARVAEEVWRVVLSR